MVTWHAPEFEYREKGVSWYWLTIIIAVLLIALAVWQRNFLFGVFVIVAEILVILWGGKKPRMLTFAVDEREFTIGDREHHSWSEFLSFSAEERKDLSLFIFQSRGARPALYVLVPPAQFPEVKQVLLSRLPYVEHERSLVEAVEEFFGF